MCSLGLTFEELEPLQVERVREYFIKRERKQSIPGELIRLRFDMLNKRRHEKKRMIIEKREQIIN